MKGYAILIGVVVLIGVLLLAGVVLAQSGGGSSPSTLYTVERGAAFGGTYHLTNLTWQVEGSASGARYLLGPASPTLRGNGCCCTYLPCVLRNH